MEDLSQQNWVWAGTIRQSRSRKGYAQLLWMNGGVRDERKCGCGRMDKSGKRRQRGRQHLVGGIRFFVAVAFVIFACSAWSTEISSEQASVAAANWMSKSQTRLGAQFKRSALPEVSTFKDGSGRALWHVVSADGGGFVVMSGDSEITPVVAFSDSDDFVAEVGSPLYDMLMTDMAQRLRRKGE